MTHREKVDFLIEQLGKRGERPANVAPPVFRLLWALGLEVPPPLFLGFLPLALFAGVFFAFFFGVFMGLFYLAWPILEAVWSGHPEVLGGPLLFRLGVVAGGALIAGVLFGLTMATIVRWKAAKLGLPAWDRYPGPGYHDDRADDLP